MGEILPLSTVRRTFVIGAGTTFPHCPEHQPANLAGDLGGEGGILRGGVVNGPNAADKLKDLNSFPTMRKCPTGQGNPFAAFDGRGGGFMDHVGAWQAVESADDFTATALLSFTLSAAPPSAGPTPADGTTAPRGDPRIRVAVHRYA
ncbi:glycoside hydrolase family 9 protein [Streptomyces sp. NBC_00122]|uniref:glycoside hydrolase family 9 protein n=1 Tax=Streptomyces sp. NBC_00122 TaxID=2903623 RepID=UPI003248C7C5